jgi:hypothetical protein
MFIQYRPLGETLVCDGTCGLDAGGIALMGLASLHGMLAVLTARQRWEQARAAVEARAGCANGRAERDTVGAAGLTALGFSPISEAFERRGSVATRMACWLPGRALARRARAGDDGADEAGPTSGAA